MDSGIGGPVFIDTIPEFREINGIVHIYRNGECRAAMQMSVFEKYISEGFRLIRDFHAREDAKVPIAFVRRRSA